MVTTPDQLSRIRIKGYKSICECDICLGSINVLIGSNGAGKSNFISALEMLQETLSKRLQYFVALRGINSLFFEGIKNTDSISLEVFFGLNSYGFSLVPSDDNKLIFNDEHFGFHGYWDNITVIGQGHTESVWETGANNGTDAYIVPILKNQKWRVYHFHDTSRNAKVKRDHLISDNIALKHDAENLAAFLYRLKTHHLKSYIEIVNSIQLVAPFFGDFVLEPLEGNNERITLKWMQKGCEDVFNASQLSDGTLRFICLATLLLQPRELQPTTIIVDEPELGLHPFAITVFSEMVKQLSAEKQIIISTQSVELLNQFNVEDIIVVDHSQSGSCFNRLEADQLNAWLNDYSLGELWLKNILGGRLSQ